MPAYDKADIQRRMHGASGLAQLRVLIVRLCDPCEQLDRVGAGAAVAKADDRQPPDGRVRVPRGELVQERAERVDVAGMVPRERLERDQRGAPRGGALVLEAAAQQLELLAEAELRDRAVALRAHPVVGVPRGGFDLLVPLDPERRDRALVPGLRELVRAGSRLDEGHAGWSERGAGPT